MPETILLAAAAFLLLAGASHRFRREAGVTRPAERRMLRAAAAMLLVAGAACAGSPLTGEWCVRLLVASSVAGLAVVLALSAAPAAVLAPLRRVMTR